MAAQHVHFADPAAQFWAEENRQQFAPVKFNPKSKYQAVRKLDQNELGKNWTTTEVESKSKKDFRTKKWMRKEVCHNYSLVDATSEIFYGQLAAKIFGKNIAPKTKFNPERKGIVSRILGDTTSKTMSMLNYISSQTENTLTLVTKAAQLGLIKTLAYGVIIGDRDLAMRNIIVKYESNITESLNTVNQIYGIDHEFGGYYTSCLASVRNFVPLVLENVVILTDILISNAGQWAMGGSAFDYNADKEIVAELNAILSDKVTQNEVKQVFSTTTAAIAHNNFELCQEIKQDMLAQVLSHPEVYSATDINLYIKPAIDEAIRSVKENVAEVNKCIPGTFIDNTAAKFNHVFL